MTSTNKEMFFAIGRGAFIPGEIGYYRDGLTPMGDRLDARRVTLSQRATAFIKTTPHLLQDRLFYSPYCKEEGLMVKRTPNSLLGEYIVEVPAIPFREVTLDELVGDIKWQNFMDRYQLPREVLVRNVAEAIRMIPREDTRYLDAWDLTRFDQNMEVGSYRVALVLIPDLNDEEAKVLFNNLTTVKSISQKLAAISN